MTMGVLPISFEGLTTSLGVRPVSLVCTCRPSRGLDGVCIVLGSAVAVGAWKWLDVLGVLVALRLGLIVRRRVVG